MSERFAEELSRSAIEEEQERWMNCYFPKLAYLYRKSACLWKKDNKHYLAIERRHRAYGRIHEAMGLPRVTFVEIVLRIHEMRRLYVEELKRLLEAESRGDCYKISFPWFYDLHRFLYPYLDYDEAAELHNADASTAEQRETEVPEPGRNPSNCSCAGYPTPSRNTVEDRFLPSGRAFGTLASVSSPVVSLPEVRTHPRTCPRSCSRLTRTRNQLNESPSRCDCTTARDSSSYYEKLKRHGVATTDELSGARQEREHEFTVCGLRDGSSSTDSRGSDLDHFEVFSKVMASRLRELDKPLAAEAQSKIQKILANFGLESKRRQLNAAT